MSRKESEIQKSIIDWLRIQPNTFVFRVFTFGVPIGRTGTFRKNYNKGIADILGVKNGRFFAFEVKKLKAKLEDHQEMWLRHVDDAGGYACVVRSLDDAIEAFKEI